MKIQIRIDFGARIYRRNEIEREEESAFLKAGFGEREK
jgi:hypothetical protein